MRTRRHHTQFASSGMHKPQLRSVSHRFTQQAEKNSVCEFFGPSRASCRVCETQRDSVLDLHEHLAVSATFANLFDFQSENGTSGTRALALSSPSASL